MKLKVLAAAIVFSIGSLAVDRILFYGIVFNFPNEMEWDTSPWYNFLSKRRNIEFQESEKGVLVVGSSVALYSVFPDGMFPTDSFARTGSARAEFYAHPSMSPSDFYFYKEDIASKNPTAVVYVFNPADFQLEYIKKKESKLYFDEVKYFQDSVEARHQNRLLYPQSFLRERWREIGTLSKSNLQDFLVRSLLFSVRLRSFFYDPFVAWYMHRFRLGRSYHYYTGIIPDNGIYLRGWAKPKFEIECEIDGTSLKDSFFLHRPDAKLAVFRVGRAEPIWERRYEKPGWHKLDIEFSDRPKTVRLRFETDTSVSSDEVDSRIFGREEIYGIRLSQNFCRKDFRRDISYRRIESLDDSRLTDMNSREYDEDYDLRLYKNQEEEGALNRLKTVRKSKELLSASDSYLEWSEMKYLRKTVSFLKEKGIRVVLINSPENPLERGTYENGVWYKGYLQFLGSLKSQGVTFHDASALISDKRGFLDPHHLTYRAALEATRYYSEWVRDDLSL
ncbi:hypothetical protein [Leptospira fletcheri]|uniref:hypothetical protein n=1 Tax=Leptospira fletcheri TaxID=2484981 RepID=UPI001FE385C7|nr:hypothetical protein [Leptospira fletcheri]